MLKVVLADDEKKIIFLLKKLINWEELGYEIAGVAGDGIHALELVRDLQPDVLLTDIKMPGCDGIELIRQAKELQKDIHAIIISGYREFEYAQNALKYGVEDYLLKPLKKDEISRILLKIRGSAEEKQLSDHRQKKTAEKREELMLLHLKECAADGKAFPEYRQLNEEYGFSFCDGCYYVLAVKPDIASGWSRAEEVQVLMQHSLEVVRQEIPAIAEEFAAAVFPEGILLVIQNRSYSSVDVHQVLTRIRKGIEKQRDLFWSVRVTIAVGSVHQTSAALPDSMRAALWLCRDRICSSQLMRVAKTDYHEPVRQYHMESFVKRRFRSNCELLDEERFERELMDSCDTLRELDGLSGSMVEDWFQNVLEVSLSGMQAAGTRSFVDRMSRDFWYCASLDEVYELLLKGLKGKMQELRERREVTENRPIAKAKEYMQQHFREECKLEDVSAWVGFNTTYFSTFFKKETGTSFTDYLTQLRISKAKELLCRADLTIQDVCEEVGYRDMKYFSRLFKKNAGITPSEYRKMYQ